jgi:sugar phosphate isomerase/epimerase
VDRKVSYGVAVSHEVLGEGASVPLQGGIAEGMATAAALGFECVELHIRNPGEFDPKALARLSAETGVRIAAIGTGLEYSLNGLSLTSDDPIVREKAAQRMREHIDLAAHFGAVVFLGLIRGKCGRKALLPEYLDRLEQQLAPLAEYAAEKGAPTGLEPVAYYFSDLLNTTAETLDFLKRPGLEGIGLLLDTHHIHLEDTDVDASFRSCAGRITHVHLSDSNRRYPGAGNIDFLRVARTLDAIGYAGAVSLEILPAPSGEEAARRGIAQMRQLWDSPREARRTGSAAATGGRR